MRQLPIPVQVGTNQPTEWAKLEARQQGPMGTRRRRLFDRPRPTLADNNFDWEALGLEPRWIGFDTADCVAAIEPSIYSNEGADEFNRFREGVESRGEVALVISSIGKEEDVQRRDVLFPSDDSVRLAHFKSTVTGRPLGQGAKVHVAEDLNEIDRLLALRILNLKPAPRWRSLSLEGETWEGPAGRYTSAPQGTLIPLVETALGEPVIAVWIAPDSAERRYIVPREIPWQSLLTWLVEQALPEFVPAAMRRARRHLDTDTTLMTRREQKIREALRELETDYRVRKDKLEEELERAVVAATSVREGLLYGTGQALVTAVRSVLESAGITVHDLDEMLGDTKNADLLCTFDGRSRLIEVKSASGNAPERAYEDLVRHLRSWPHLPNTQRIEGGVLIVNHQHRKAPQERRAEPYDRPEFLAAKTEPILTTVELLEAWRNDDWQAVRQRVFPGTSNQPDENAPKSSPEKRRGWLRRAQK